MRSQGQTKALQPIPPIMAHHVLHTHSNATPEDPILLPSIRAWKHPTSLTSNTRVKSHRSRAISWGTRSPRTVTPPPSSPRFLPAMVVPKTAPGMDNHNSNSNNSNSNSNISSSYNNSAKFHAQWLYFNNSRWIPLDRKNHHKLERTLELGGVFADIQDTHFPAVQRIRVFPRADYLSYQGIRYRISRVLLPPV